MALIACGEADPLNITEMKKKSIYFLRTAIYTTAMKKFTAIFSFGLSLILPLLAPLTAHGGGTIYPAISEDADLPRKEQSLFKAKDLELEDMVAKAHGQRQTLEQNIYQRNLRWIEWMEKQPIPALQNASMVTTLTREQIIATTASIEQSSATDSRPSLKKKYDPTGDWGFCFLRAHYYAGTAIQRGLDMRSVQKVFLIGTMTLLGQKWLPTTGWSYHVATAVRGWDGRWYMLDNHLPRSVMSSKVYTVREWYEYYRKYLDTADALPKSVRSSMDAKTMFVYFADPNRVGPDEIGYYKAGYYGTDKNHNGILEASEQVYNGAFIAVDKHIQPKLHACSRERYKPVPATSPQCIHMTDAEKKQIADREWFVWQWKADADLEHWRVLYPDY